MSATERLAVTNPPATGAQRLVVLGGGAVVRECFAPAIARLGLAGRTAILDPHATAGSTMEGIRLEEAGYSEYFTRPPSERASHCIVALPNHLHYDAVAAALKAGMDVLCEKPLSLNSAECRALAVLAKAHGRALAVNMVRRLFHSVQIAASVLEQGWLGELQSVSISHGGGYGWPIASLAPFLKENGGVLADMGVHYLDLARMLFGRLLPVSYDDDYRGGVESECRFALRTAAGVPVDIALSRIGPLENSVVIEGSRGRLEFGVDDFARCLYTPAGTADATAITLGRSDGTGWSFSDYFAEQVQRFLAGAATVTADDAAETAALIEWGYGHRTPSDVRPAAITLETGPVFVTGATGFIGNHLLDRLTADGQSAVTAAFRTFRSCAQISRFPVSYRQLDLLGESDLRAAVRGQRYVFHLAVARNADTERAITVDGTRRLVEAAIAENVECIVVLSTMYVFGHPGGPLDETAPYNPIGGSYGSAKAEMERWCLERAKTSEPTRIVVLIPTCVYGPGGDTYTRLPVSLAREQRFAWIESGHGIANVVYVDNLVDAMVRAAVTPAAHGQRFIVNDDSLTWREFLTPMLGPWADAVASPDAAEFARMTSVKVRPATVRDVAASVLRSPEVWNTVSRTRVANQLRPLVKKYVPAVGRMKNRAGKSNGPAPQLPPQPPAWLPEVFGPTSTVFSSRQARTVLGWAPTVRRETAVAESILWLEHQQLYEPVK